MWCVLGQIQQILQSRLTVPVASGDSAKWRPIKNTSTVLFIYWLLLSLLLVFIALITITEKKRKMWWNSEQHSFVLLAMVWICQNTLVNKSENPCLSTSFVACSGSLRTALPMTEAVTPLWLDVAASEVSFSCVEMSCMHLVSLCSLGLSFCCPSLWSRAPGSWWWSIKPAGSFPSEHQRRWGRVQWYLNPYLGPSGSRRLEPRTTMEESLVLPFECYLSSIGDSGFRITPTYTASGLTQKKVQLWWQARRSPHKRGVLGTVGSLVCSFDFSSPWLFPDPGMG